MQSGQLGLTTPTLSTNVTDLLITWVGGQPRLYAVTRPGPGAGLSVYDLSATSGPAAQLAIQPFAAPVTPDGTPQIEVAGQTLIAAGLTPSGWASYQLGATGLFASPLNSALAFTPSAVTSADIGGQTFVYLAPQGQTTPLAFLLGPGGTLGAVGASAPTSSPGPDSLDRMTVAQTAGGTFLLATSAGTNMLSSFAIASNGALTAVGQYSASDGIGMSKPTDVTTLTVHGVTYAIAAGSQSSSLSVFRLLDGGQFYEIDHVVDNLATRFSGATALSTLTIGDRAYVITGGADGGIDVMALLPDGRLVHLLTLADTGAMSLADVAAIATARIGQRNLVFVTSETETGITQLDLDLGAPGISLYKTAGVQTGTNGADLLFAGGATTAVHGGDGDDLIVADGAGGAATLYGGNGADLFVLGPSAAIITVADYRAGVDRLDLTSFPMLRNLSQLTITTTATGAEISCMGTLIRIEGFDFNPIPVQAFAQSQMIRLDRFAAHPTAEIVQGTAAADSLTAIAEGSAILGFGGNDSLTGLGGNDVLDGEAGHDTLTGGDGQDRLFGGAGLDQLLGGNGHDLLDAGQDDDLLFGGDGDDTLAGGAGRDSLLGENGNDHADGGPGDDTLRGGIGNDQLFGGQDRDQLFGEAGDDGLDGGSGDDTLSGEAGNDTLQGGDGNDLVLGLDDNDSVMGGAGQDTVVGHGGHDTLDGGAGQDVLWGD